MSVDRTRHGRQIRLPEIGEAGQERLGAGIVLVAADGYAAEIEAAYLAAAGVSVSRPREAAPAPAPDQRAPLSLAPAVSDAVKALGVRDPAALDVAEGAMRALLAMRRILGVGVA